MKRTLAWLSTIITIALFLVACSPQYQGYAVLLWPATESGLAEGVEAPVLAGVEQEVVTLSVDGMEQGVESWRLLVFEDSQAAQEFAAQFEPWEDEYARSMRTALPVRERPDASSSRIYRLREGEVIKVLDRTDDVTEQGNLTDYWYRVLTREGTIGWVFGYYLELTGASGRSTDGDSSREVSEQLLQDIAGVAWRPDYFDDMISSGHINLDRFSPRFGLFADTAGEEIRIVLPAFQRTYSYDDISSPSAGVIRFIGTSLELSIEGDRELEALYTVDGRDRTETFVRLEEDLAEIISAERARRSSSFEQIYNRGNGLVSSTFGEMRLTDRGAITWRGFERLVPTVLPASFDGTATMEYSLFLSDELRGKYDGAMLLRLGAGQSTAFVYTILDDGLRLTYIPDNLIDDDRVVTGEPVSPVVMFYRFINI